MAERETETRGAEEAIFWATDGENRKEWHRTLLEIRALPEAPRG